MKITNIEDKLPTKLIKLLIKYVMKITNMEDKLPTKLIKLLIEYAMKITTYRGQIPYEVDQTSNRVCHENHN